MSLVFSTYAVELHLKIETMIKELFPEMKITFSGTESTTLTEKTAIFYRIETMFPPIIGTTLPRIETMPLLKWIKGGSKAILELTKV
jgi:hypothetical protein